MSDPFDQIDQKIINNDQFIFKKDDTFLTKSLIPFIILMLRTKLVHYKDFKIQDDIIINNIKSLIFKIDKNNDELKNSKYAFNTFLYLQLYDKSSTNMKITVDKYNGLLTLFICQNKLNYFYDNIYKTDFDFIYYNKKELPEAIYLDNNDNQRIITDITLKINFNKIHTHITNNKFSTKLLNFLNELNMVLNSNLEQILHIENMKTSIYIKNDNKKDYKFDFLKNMYNKKYIFKNLFLVKHKNYDIIINLLNKMIQKNINSFYSIRFLQQYTGFSINSRSIKCILHNNVIYYLSDFSIIKFQFNPYVNFIISYLDIINKLDQLRSNLENKLLNIGI